MRAWLFSKLNGRKQAHLGAIPGPTPRFPLGTASDFLSAKPWEVCAEYGRRYGGITLVWVFNKPAVVLNDPELIGEGVLDTARHGLLQGSARSGTEARHYTGEPVHHELRPGLGRSASREPILDDRLRKLAHTAGRTAPAGDRGGCEGLDHVAFREHLRPTFIGACND